MPLRIEVDVDDEASEVRIVPNAFAMEWLFKKASGAIEHMVDSLGIGGEEIRKGLTGAASRHSGIRLWITDSDKHMEMVGHQAIGECLTDRLYVPAILLQKYPIVRVRAEKILAVIAAVVDVIRCPDL